MGKFLGFTGLLLVAAALGAGVWWAWPILFPSLPAGWLSTLAKADADLLQNRPDLARKALSPIPKALPVMGWLEWEKRVQAIATQTQGWTWASEVATAAHGQYPGNSDLAAYSVYTLLHDRRPKEASALADKVLAGTPWESLRTQARIEAAGLASGDWSELKQTLAQPSHDAFLVYQQLASLDPEPEIRKNALLSALSEGRLDEAREHLSVLTPAQRDEPPFDRLQGLMAYDSGDWNRAAALLKAVARSQPDTLLTLADVYLHLGDRNQAKIFYDQLLADQPGAIPLSMAVNRVTLFVDSGEYAQAQALLLRVADQNPGRVLPALERLEWEVRFHLGEADTVRKVLDQRLSAWGETDDGLEAELLKGRLFPDLNSVPRLWSLLHRHPGYAPLAERLAWQLLVAQDFDGAERALDLHEAAVKKAGQDSPWWSRFLRALLLALEDKLPESSDAFASVPGAWRDATFFADWSLTSLVQAQKVDADQRKPLLQDSLEKLSRAVDLLPPAADPSSLHRRSLWLTRRGELQASLVPLSSPSDRGALRSAATEDLHQAVQLDPDNFRAQFLLRQAMTVKQDSP